MTSENERGLDHAGASTIDPACILFSHIAMSGPDSGLDEDPSYRKIDAYCQKLGSVLAQQRCLLFVFYDAAWVEFMNAIGSDFDFEHFAKGSHAAVRMGERLRLSDNATPWIRVITAKELSAFVNTLRGDLPGEHALNLRRFFVSDRKRMLYDNAKVVEAVIRLRHIGSGIPVLRVDEDVLTALVESETGPDQLSKMLRRAQTNHQHCIESKDVYTFVFSAGYRSDSTPEGFLEWATAYSTRVFPALIARKELLEHRIEQPLADFAAMAEPALKKDVVDAFYATISRFGADAQKGVISGSLFCLSDGAILDLPPFSNFRANVIWIDDHLKYALHKDLGHIGQKPIQVPSLDESGSRKLTARIPNCHLPKGRSQIRNFGSYVLGVYMPALLRGMIMDKWLCGTSDSKNLSEPTRSPNVFAQCLRSALAHGRFEARERERLRELLRAQAIERFKEVKEEFGTHPQTFASIWINGLVRRHAEKIGATLAGDDGREPGPSWIGWGAWESTSSASNDNKRPMETGALTPAISADIENLIEDALAYIDWALYWPRFVQVVRVLDPKAAIVDARESWGLDADRNRLNG